MKLKTFKEASSRVQLVDEALIKTALDDIFNANGTLYKADEVVDMNYGIDYFYSYNGNRLSLDLKIRSGKHRKLILEVEWYNKPKKPWLYASKADFFLFAHTDDDFIEFYLVPSKDARNLVQNETPQNKKAWIDANYTVAIMFFYDYDNLRKIGGSYARTKVKRT